MRLIKWMIRTIHKISNITLAYNSRLEMLIAPKNLNNIATWHGTEVFTLSNKLEDTH